MSVPVRDAASVVIVRSGPRLRILMGRRGDRAAFMPAKYVFPGGAVDPADGDGAQDPAGSLIACARRELLEETGLALVEGLDLPMIFRAITPPGPPRRFDTRFLLASATDLVGDPDDLGRAGPELSDLRWVDLAEARTLDLPFITEVVLAELEERLADPHPNRPVPMFDNRTADSSFRYIAPLSFCSHTIGIAIDGDRLRV